jgi:hypothetical protein
MGQPRHSDAELDREAKAWLIAQGFREPTAKPLPKSLPPVPAAPAPAPVPAAPAPAPILAPAPVPAAPARSWDGIICHRVKVREEILETAYSRRPCFACGLFGRCTHREDYLEIVIAQYLGIGARL